MAKIAINLLDRWVSLFLALRRLASLLVDGLIFALFLGQLSQAEYSVDGSQNLLISCPLVLLYFSIPQASLGKLIFQFKVVSKQKFVKMFRNIQISVLFIVLSVLIFSGEYPVNPNHPSSNFQNLAGFILIYCIVDKFPVIFGGKRTIADCILGTMAVPKEMLGHDKDVTS